MRGSRPSRQEALQVLDLQLPPRFLCGMIERTPAMPVTAINLHDQAPAGHASPSQAKTSGQIHWNTSRPDVDLFSGHYALTGPDAKQAFWERTGFSAVIHTLVAVAIVSFIRYAPAGAMLSQPMHTILNPDIVWLNQPGPGGGGGGGGNRMQGPIRKAEAPGKDKITVPVTKAPPPPSMPEVKPSDVPPPPAFDIPAKSMADGSLQVLGSLDGVRGSLSQGPGSGGGAGTGTGTGIGPGTGSGLGPGYGGGTGGGVYRPGAGIENPVLLKEVKPMYTAEGMRAKIQGTVVLECVINADGTVGSVSVLKSLDPVFGLDQEAIKAAKQWRFIPAKKQGVPVAMLATLELTFTLR
jgi:periplasmic protein TonB